MENELAVYESGAAIVTSFRNNYKVTIPMTGRETQLKRDVDFGVIPGTKSPSLYKAGAEKIVQAYGFFTRYSIESKIEDPERPLFFYTVKCELVKVAMNGTEYVFTTGYGSANTLEKRNGRNDAWNAANATLKMAQKRALVSAAISVGGLSDAFTMDMEDSNFVNEGYEKIAKAQDPDAPINNAQMRRMYAIGGNAGLNAGKVNEVIKSMGFNSIKNITQKDYDRLCKLIGDYDENKQCEEELPFNRKERGCVN